MAFSETGSSHRHTFQYRRVSATTCVGIKSARFLGPFVNKWERRSAAGVVERVGIVSGLSTASSTRRAAR